MKRKGSMNIDTSNINVFLSEIKEMRRNGSSLHKKENKEKSEKSDKKRDLKILMSNPSYQNFFKNSKPSSKENNSKSTNVLFSSHTKYSTKYSNFT